MTGPIPKKYFTEVCKIGQGAQCCRYLAADKDGLCCLKRTELAAELDERVKNLAMNAQADNCVGWDLICESPS